MSTFNPYEPPKARLDGAVRMDAAGDCWRDGKQLVVRPGCTLPDRCIKCNEPAEHPLQARRFYWHHPALYLLVLVNLLIYLIIALIVRRKTPVTVGMCKRHNDRRRTAITLATVGSLIGLVLMFAAGGDKAVLLILAGGVLLLASLIGGIVGGRVMVVSRIGDNYTRFSGCGPAFLASLPTFYRTR